MRRMERSALNERLRERLEVALRECLVRNESERETLRELVLDLLRREAAESLERAEASR